MSAPKARSRPAPKRRAAGGETGDYGARALRRLAWLMENAESEQAQVAAAKELLGRAYDVTGAASGSGAESGMDGVVARLRELRLLRGGRARDGK